MLGTPTASVRSPWDAARASPTGRFQRQKASPGRAAGLRHCYPTAFVRSAWDAARTSPTGRFQRQKASPGRAAGLRHCYPDGPGSIGMGRRKGVPYRPVPKARGVARYGGGFVALLPRRPSFDRHGTPQGRPLQAGSKGKRRRPVRQRVGGCRGDPCGRPCWVSRRPRFDRHGTPQGRPLQAGSKGNRRRPVRQRVCGTATRRPSFDRHGTPQGRPLQAGSKGNRRRPVRQRVCGCRGDPCGRPCWVSRRPLFDRHGTPQGRPLQAGF